MLGDFAEYGGYEMMTSGVSVGPVRAPGDMPKSFVTLDGADYGQKRCRDMAPDARERMMSNARLISAAPDLAEALDRVIAIVQYEEIWSAKHVSEWDAAMNAARSALSKAKGE